MTGVYKYLQSCLVDRVTDSVPRDDQHRATQKLADTPFIVSDVGQTFVRPRQV